MRRVSDGPPVGHLAASSKVLTACSIQDLPRPRLGHWQAWLVLAICIHLYTIQVLATCIPVFQDLMWLCAVGRVLGEMGVKGTPIDTKGYQSLLSLVDNTTHDSFELYYGLFMYNQVL